MPKKKFVKFPPRSIEDMCCVSRKCNEELLRLGVEECCNSEIFINRIRSAYKFDEFPHEAAEIIRIYRPEDEAFYRFLKSTYIPEYTFEPI